MAALITTNTADKKRKKAAKAKVKDESDEGEDSSSSSSEAESGDGWSQADDDEVYVPSPTKQKARQSRLTFNQPSTSIKRPSNERRRPTVTLVVCPMTLLAQWKDELVRCDSRLNVHVYYGTARTDLEETIDEGVDVVITRSAAVPVFRDSSC